MCELTDKQYQIFKAVRKYRTLQKILNKTKAGDYIDLENAVDNNMLNFSDNRMDENTIVTLTNRATEELETRLHADRDKLFTRRIAIYGAITGTAAIIAEIVLHFL